MLVESSCLIGYLNAARSIFETSFIIQVWYIVRFLTLSSVSALITSPGWNIKYKCTHSFGNKDDSTYIILKPEDSELQLY